VCAAPLLKAGLQRRSGNEKNARRGIGGRSQGRLVASLFGNRLRSFRPFLSDGLRIAAAAARRLHFPSLDAITPFDLDVWDWKWDNYRGSLLNYGPILRTGRQ
jgi:hypothetical protein